MMKKFSNWVPSKKHMAICSKVLTGTIFKPHSLKMAKMQIALCCTKPSTYSIQSSYKLNKEKVFSCFCLINCRHLNYPTKEIFHLLIWMFCAITYFRISLGRDKYKWEKWSLLLISWCAPDKVRYQSLKFDCKRYITPFYSCLITIWCCYMLFSPFVFVLSKQNSKVLMFRVMSIKEYFIWRVKFSVEFNYGLKFYFQMLHIKITKMRHFLL